MHEPEGDPPGRGVRVGAYRLGRAFHAVQGAFHRAEEHAARGGQRDGAAVAGEERDAEVGFEADQGAAEGGLRHAEFPRGARDVFVAGDGGELREARREHGRPVRVSHGVFRAAAGRLGPVRAVLMRHSMDYGHIVHWTHQRRASSVGFMPTVHPPVSTGRAEASDDRLRPGTAAYRRAILALFAAGTATFLLMYSTQGLLPAISASLAVTPAQASLTVALATGGLAVALIPLSALSERFGRTPVMTASVFSAAAIGLAVPFAPDLTVLVVLRTLQGVALAGLPATAMAYLAEEVAPSAVASAIGLYVAGNSVGGMCSRVIAGFVAQFAGWRVALGVLGVLALACAVTFVLLSPRARNFHPVTVSPRTLARTVRGHLGNPLLVRLYLLGMLFMAVFGSVYTVLAYRLSAAPFHLSEGLIGAMFLVYLVGTATSAGAGRLVARLGRRGALYAGIATVAAGLLVSLATSLAAVLFGLVLITAGFFIGHAVASGAVSRTATSARAQASAIYLTAYYVGNSLGGLTGAAAYHSHGWPGTATVGLTAMTAATAITFYATWKAAVSRPGTPRCQP